MSNHIAIVGASGAVGQAILDSLHKRQFPISSIRVFASSRSAGKTVRLGNTELVIEEAGPDVFAGIDIAFFSAGATTSRKLVPAALAAGATVIDNSSAFRMDADVPLIVPNVNDEHMGTENLVANPNCTAAILTSVLQPLRQLAEPRRIVLTSMNAVSGAGRQATEELIEQTRVDLAGGVPEAHRLHHVLAFNTFNIEFPVLEDGGNTEELKVMQETRRILDIPELSMSVTCVRVPVLRAHSLSVNVDFGVEVDPEEARQLLAAAPGVQVLDDPEKRHFPMPRDVAGQEDVFVGRIRRDPGHPTALNLWIVGDQLLRGAALNAVQIAEIRAS
ncbi:MAG: aspartate-semialdehyde dehydrogenase [bacterium]|nr:aspartate-semialdehyde dehydrogenase [bacterium]